MKKIFLWTLYSAFVGILIYGAIDRTSSKINDENGEGSANSSSAVEHDGLESHANEGDGHERITLRGSVTAISNREMVMLATNGRQVELARRAWHFAQEQGFTPKIEDEVVVVGFYDDAVFETIQIVDLESGQSATLRDDDGHSLWSGNGEED